MILGEVAKRLKGRYYQEEQEHGTDPNNRWRTVSCLQKAVRFGDVAMARFCASVAFDMDPKYVLRRLGIVAVEDVAAGDPFAVLAVLAVIGSSGFRKSCDERRLIIFLAEMLAEAHGDRNMTDLLNAADFDATSPKQEWAMLPSAKLGEIAVNKDVELVQRSVAIWLMAGTKKYWGHTMPTGNDRPATPVFRLMVEQGLPRAFLYGAAKTASRLNEAFWVSFYLMNEQLLATETVEVIADKVPEVPRIGKLLGAAYDMHTREGKEALRRFGGSCKAIKQFRDSTFSWQAYMTALHEAVFYVEGGVLKTRVAYAGSEEMRDLSWRNIMSRTGLPEPEHQPFFQAVAENLDYLNKLRAEVLWEKLNKK
ncbi:hypothetical protein [Sinorhizobium fredii]|uniref:hypothetical protein n=1 Tax=Rhizobium fredii TaxID=380 RepID=UPI0018659261|nr:hypothetical protein [Sinorhizobium fredii]